MCRTFLVNRTPETHHIYIKPFLVLVFKIDSNLWSVENITSLCFSDKQVNSGLSEQPIAHAGPVFKKEWGVLVWFKEVLINILISPIYQIKPGSANFGQHFSFSKRFQSSLFKRLQLTFWITLNHLQLQQEAALSKNTWMNPACTTCPPLLRPDSWGKGKQHKPECFW